MSPVGCSLSSVFLIAEVKMQSRGTDGCWVRPFCSPPICGGSYTLWPLSQNDSISLCPCTSRYDKRLVHLLTCPYFPCLRTPPWPSSPIYDWQIIWGGKWTTACVQRSQLRSLYLDNTNKNSLWRKAFTLSPLSMTLAVRFLQISLIRLRKFPSTPSLLDIFPMKGCWGFLKGFSTSIEMIMWCFFPPHSISMVYYIDWFSCVEQLLCS